MAGKKKEPKVKIEKKTKPPTAMQTIQANLDKIEELAEGGHSVKVIAEAIGVSRSSLYDYAKKDPDIMETIKRGRVKLVTDVKSALKKKALGYDYEEVTTSIKSENGKQVQTIEKKIKHIPPDVGACHLLLKNYDEEWHNDDQTTIEMKKAELELKKKKTEAEVW